VAVKKFKHRFYLPFLKLISQFLPIFLLISGIYYLSQSQFFSIKQINCQLDNFPCPLKLEPILINSRNKNIFTFSKASIENQLNSSDLNFADIQVKKKLPQTLIITINSRLPLAQLAPVKNMEFTALTSTASASLSGQIINQFYNLDSSGTVYAQSDQQAYDLALVLIPENQPISLGKSDISQLIVEIINSLQEHFVSFESVAWLNQDVLIVKTIPLSYAILNIHKSFSSQVASLQYILAGSKIEKELPTKIDLRFDKPVLTY